MSRLIVSLFLAGFLALPVAAEQFWIAYEGNDYPENEGWQRIPFGGGAQRELDNGNLVIDSRASFEIADFYRVQRPINLQTGESFILQWRLRIAEVVGLADPVVGAYADDGFGVGFQFGHDTLRSPLEGATVGFDPGLFHAFELRSVDLRAYQPGLFTEFVLF